MFTIAFLSFFLAGHGSIFTYKLLVGLRGWKLTDNTFIVQGL